jgi:hypothetical protein
MWVVLWITVGTFITDMLGAIFGRDSPEIRFPPGRGDISIGLGTTAV